MPTANVARPGDTILIAFTVPEQSLDQNDGSYLDIEWPDCTRTKIAYGMEVHSIIRPPYVPKVGDVVRGERWNDIWTAEVVAITDTNYFLRYLTAAKCAEYRIGVEFLMKRKDITLCAV